MYITSVAQSLGAIKYFKASEICTDETSGTKAVLTPKVSQSRAWSALSWG